MAHFAEINGSSVVLRVLVVDNGVVPNVVDASNEDLGQAFLAIEMGFGGTWKQTSYNATFRKNFAGVGHRYDAALDAFVPPKPYPSWILDAECKWQPPAARPLTSGYDWDEATLSWVVI